MKKLLLILIALALTACDPATPEERAFRNKQIQEKAQQYDYQIVKLFTRDGCTLYRFNDQGHRVYYASCNGSTSHDYTCGKNETCEDHVETR